MVSFYIEPTVLIYILTDRKWGFSSTTDRLYAVFSRAAAAAVAMVKAAVVVPATKLWCAAHDTRWNGGETGRWWLYIDEERRTREKLGFESFLSPFSAPCTSLPRDSLFWLPETGSTPAERKLSMKGKRATRNEGEQMH